MARLFVSYSGRARTDKEFALHLMARLKDLQLSPWVFEQRGAEVPVGAHINGHCRAQIVASDLFICVISDSSLESPSTQVEVDCALRLLGPQKIFQIQTTAKDMACWPAHYRALAPFKRADATAGRDTDLEHCLQALCTRLQADYSPPGDGAPRLPMVQRLTQEMSKATPVDKSHEAGDFNALRLRASTVAKAYREGRIEHAYSALDRLIFDLDEAYPDQAFYFPQLIKGMLLLQLSDRRPAHLDQASDIFSQLLDDPRLVDKIDENLHAAIGVACLKRGAFAQAVQSYRTAHRIVQARNEVDADILHNLVIAIVASDADAPCADAQALLDAAARGGATSDPRLLERLQALRAVLCARRGDVAGAREHLRDVNIATSDCVDMLLRVAQELAASHQACNGSSARRSVGSVEDMFELALRHASGQQRTAVVLSLAGHRYALGRCAEALAVLESLEPADAARPRVLVERSWCLKRLHRHGDADGLLAEAAALCTPVLRDAAAQALFDFLYYRGFAAWLCGLTAQAERDFADSRYARHHVYATVARQHGPPPLARLRSLLADSA